MMSPAASVQKSPKELHYLKEGKPDAIELLAPPPLPGSEEQAADLEEVRFVFHHAPSNEVAEAVSQDHGVSISYFAPVVGEISSNNLPVTAKFLRHVQSDASMVVNRGKDFWKRPRPFVEDPSLAISKKTPKSFSYPSGHSTESMTLALVLADLFPDKRDALIAEARTIGWHRVQIARHYPTDIYAGRVLAQAIVKEMEKEKKFQKDLAMATAEIAGRKSGKN